MARPKIPLISRRKALETALQIVDTEGLDALSIRRLGQALNVNGASLYHHFKNKDDILVGVTQLALSDVSAPRDEHQSWRTWLPLNAFRTRQALVAHPELIPIMLRRAHLGIGLDEVEASVKRLRDEGLPIAMISPLMEALELLAITSALQEVGVASSAVPENADSAQELRAALDARALSTGELFEIMASTAISVIETAVQLRETRRAVNTARG
ncbi:TetR/AcrR family transcriptional regulator [Rhodococcus sp. NPDC056960]